MSIMEEVSDRGLGWPLGIGLAVAAISAGPQIVKASRPLAKKAIKAYLAIHERAKEAFAETGEQMQDLYAEARHEYAEEATVARASVIEEHREEPKEEQTAEGHKPSRSRKHKAEEGEEK